MRCLALMAMSVISASVLAEETKPWPYYFDSKLFAGGGNQAYEAMLGTEWVGFEFSVGGYLPFNAEGDHLNGDIMLHTAKHFEMPQDTTMKLGIGARNLKPYIDYGLEFDVSPRVALTTGYRFHFEDEREHKNQMYLGFRVHFNVDENSPQASPEVLAPVEKIVEPPAAPNVVRVESRINFESSSSQLVQQKTLEDIIQKLSGKEIQQITLVGHSDSSGNEAFNVTLSQQRAQRVADYFIRHGVSKEQISITGEGSAHPIAENLSHTGRATNRRVDISIEVFHK